MFNPGPKFIIVQIIIYTLAVFPFFSSIYWQKGTLHYRQSENYKNCVILLGFLFCILGSYAGDWYHYYQTVIDLTKNPTDSTHIEPIYIWSINSLSFGNYLWWRCIIWGFAYYLVWLSIKRLGIDDLLTWTGIVGIVIIEFCTGRVYLGIALLFYGFTCIITPKHKVWSTLLGIVLMGTSILLHKSMFIFIIAALCSFIAYKKWMLALLICLIPVGMNVLKTTILPIILESEVQNSALSYLQKDSSSGGVGYAIYKNTYKYIIMLISLLSTPMIYRIGSIYKSNLRPIWQFCINLILIFFIVALSLTWAGIGGSSISGRVVQAIYLPTAILWSCMVRAKYHTSRNIVLFLVVYLLQVYNLLYAYYIQSINPEKLSL